MLQHVSGFFGNPQIPVRIPNDDTSFNPQDFPNVIFLAHGKISGKIRLVHGGVETDGSGQGLISTRVWVAREGLSKEVILKPEFDQQTLTMTLETPSSWGINTRIYHETMIQYPASLTSTGSLTVESPQTPFSSGQELSNLFFGAFKGSFSNASVELKALRADLIQIRTSNAAIRGQFEAGHLDLSTSNGSIEAKVQVRDAWDGKQSTVRTKTSNARIECTVSALETSRGLWMANTTSNGRLEIGALLAKADRASFIQNMTNNAKIHLNVDAGRTEQALEVKQKTANGSITSSIKLPPNQNFKGSADSSNAYVEVNLTEEFQGSFTLDTSNASATVEGSDLTFGLDKKSTKTGTRGHGNSEIKLHSSNGRNTLRFYKALEEFTATEGFMPAEDFVPVEGFRPAEEESEKEKEAKAFAAPEESTMTPPPYSSVPQNLL